MSELTDAELNSRLADKLGWPIKKWDKFEPASDYNHFIKYVAHALYNSPRQQIFLTILDNQWKSSPDKDDDFFIWITKQSSRFLSLAALSAFETPLPIQRWTIG